MREYRGTLTEPGRESPYRDRSVEENLDLFERMKTGLELLDICAEITEHSIEGFDMLLTLRQFGLEFTEFTLHGLQSFTLRGHFRLQPLAIGLPCRQVCFDRFYVSSPQCMPKLRLCQLPSL